jgi:hypothetical protein
VLPFVALVLLLASKIAGVFAWLRRTGDLGHPAIPIGLVLTAGLIHAGFEDWLFAVGYYLSVFFWVLACLFLDILPARLPAMYRPFSDFRFSPLRQDVAVAAPEP